MKIYIDILLLVNFIINYFLLLITCQINRLKINYKRMFLAACFGTIYTITLIIPKVRLLTSFPIKLIVSFIMVVICTKNSMIKCAKIWISYILISFLLCGICSMLSFMNSTMLISGNFEIKELSINQIFLVVIFLYIILYRIIESIKNRISKAELIYDIYIFYKNENVIVKGFMDTGNELVEPITLLPVIFVENDYIDNMIKNCSTLYSVSYNTISEENRVLKGFIPDKVILKSNSSYLERKAVICPCYHKLSNNNDYNALLSRGLI